MWPTASAVAGNSLYGVSFEPFSRRRNLLLKSQFKICTQKRYLKYSDTDIIRRNNLARVIFYTRTVSKHTQRISHVVIRLNEFIVGSMLKVHRHRFIPISLPAYTSALRVIRPLLVVISLLGFGLVRALTIIILSLTEWYIVNNVIHAVVYTASVYGLTRSGIWMRDQILLKLK